MEASGIEFGRHSAQGGKASELLDDALDANDRCVNRPGSGNIHVVGETVSVELATSKA